MTDPVDVPALQVSPDGIHVPVQTVAVPLVTTSVPGAAGWSVVQRTDRPFQTTNPY